MQHPRPPSPIGQPNRFSQGRLLGRLVNDMHAGAMAAAIRSFGGDFDRATIFMVVARQSETHSLGHARSGARLPKAISINALAASLSRPFETVRRHIHALCAEGLCLRTPAGVTVPADVHEQPRIKTLFHLQHDLLVRLVEDMAWFEIPLPEPRAHAHYDWRTGLAAAHDILLTGIEFHAHRFDRWIDMVIVVAIMSANMRPFNYDRDISLSFADFAQVPPEGMRAPVSTGMVARAMGLATSTTHRRVGALVEKGVLVRKPDGLLVTDTALSAPPMIADVRTSTDHTRQILIRLAAGGFRFDDPSRCYVEGRPLLVAFE